MFIGKCCGIKNVDLQGQKLKALDLTLVPCEGFDRSEFKLRITSINELDKIPEEELLDWKVKNEFSHNPPDTMKTYHDIEFPAVAKLVDEFLDDEEVNRIPILKCNHVGDGKLWGARSMWFQRVDVYFNHAVGDLRHWIDHNVLVCSLKEEPDGLPDCD